MTPYQLAAALGKTLPLPMQKLARSWRAAIRDLVLSNQIKALAEVSALEAPACAICDGKNVVPHKRCNGFHVVRCLQDGLIFTSPRPVDLAPFYDERYYNGGMPGVYANYTSFANEELTPEWNKRLDIIEASLGGQPGHLLDVGCATGSFLNLARDRGWQVSGVELSDWAVQSAIKMYSLNVIQGSLPDARLNSATYDAVTLWDCIEHLANPEAVLREVRRLLKPEGLLMLSTGALPHKDPSLISKWYYPPWHLYYFSEETMHKLLRKCGFEVVSYQEKDKAIPEYTLMVVLAHQIEAQA